VICPHSHSKVSSSAFGASECDSLPTRRIVRLHPGQTGSVVKGTGTSGIEEKRAEKSAVPVSPRALIAVRVVRPAISPPLRSRGYLGLRHQFSANQHAVPLALALGAFDPGPCRDRARTGLGFFHSLVGQRRGRGLKRNGCRPTLQTPLPKSTFRTAPVRPLLRETLAAL